MFETLKPQAPDKILSLMAQYKEDPRTTKIDLGVGVYKDASGLTPVMRAVKAAEHKLWQEQDTKTYTGLVGDPAFSDAMIKLVLGDAVPRNTVAAAATPAVRARCVRHLNWSRWPTPRRGCSYLIRHGRTTCRF